MAKRFTDTEKYKKPFFRNLKGEYKLFWDYLYHACDHAGIWIVDFEIAQIYLGADMQVNREDALKYFNEDEQRIIEFDKGKKWLIVPFNYFQYGELNPSNRAHNSVINRLKKENLYDENKGLIRGLQDPMDKDKDKDKDKEKRETEKKYIPEKSEVIEYFQENGYSAESAENAYQYYNASIEDKPNSKYWRDSKDNPVKNWKMKMRSIWFKPENKIKAQSNGAGIYEF